MKKTAYTVLLVIVFLFSETSHSNNIDEINHRLCEATSEIMGTLAEFRSKGLTFRQSIDDHDDLYDIAMKSLVFKLPLHQIKNLENLKYGFYISCRVNQEIEIYAD